MVNPGLPVFHLNSPQDSEAQHRFSMRIDFLINHGSGHDLNCGHLCLPVTEGDAKKCEIEQPASS